MGMTSYQEPSKVHDTFEKLNAAKLDVANDRFHLHYGNTAKRVVRKAAAGWQFITVSAGDLRILQVLYASRQSKLVLLEPFKLVCSLVWQIYNFAFALKLLDLCHSQGVCLSCHLLKPAAYPAASWLPLKMRYKAAHMHAEYRLYMTCWDRPVHPADSLDTPIQQFFRMAFST